MAPKRKSDTTTTTDSSAEPRRSTRSTTSANSDPAPPVASKPKPAPTKGKGASAAAKQEKEDEEEKEESAPAKPAKKAKKDEEEGADTVQVGEVVPDIVLKNENGEDTSLAALYEKSGLIIFSYPKADTGGCNQQAAGYRELHDELHKLGYAIVGLSRDAPKAQLAWKNKKNFKYSFLTESGQLSAQLGAKSKRNHWVIEQGGKLLEAALSVKAAEDAKKALAFVKGL